MIFWLLIPNDDNHQPRPRYTLVELYRSRFPHSNGIWDKIAEHRSDYIPVLKEYKGRAPLFERFHLIGNNSYPFRPDAADQIFYGLSFVSHIYGVETFRPSTTT